ncbi:ras guanine nucleotide exchange factor domain-containing protein [Sporodiniella umbellata]|nr:ras guanine nucleotide exchange factor domain-containing protein [Sporodiniella umbellata]
MATRDVLCHVRALYPYESNDSSSLSFKENAVIEVFAQLESGWWDGRYEGKRGWFPSNYVEIIRAANPIRRPETKNHLRLSLHVSDNVMVPNTAGSSWILQTTEDGSEQYFFNPKTNEMRYSIPTEGYVADEDDSLPPVRPARAANRLAEENRRSFEEERLPPGWVRKTTPQGRYYYCNLKTEETTWELENVDPDTGLLMTTLPNSPLASPLPREEEGEGPITWLNISSNIANAIYELKESIHEMLSEKIRTATTEVVHQIRFLLYVANCLDKDSSVHLKSSKQLRSVHRSLLAAIAKLILSSKVACSTWPSPEAFPKLAHDADDVLVSVRRLVSMAQEMQIPLKERYKPELETGVWKNPIQLNLRHHLPSNGPDASTTLCVLADNVRGAMTSLSDSLKETYIPFHQHQDLPATLEKLKADAPLLVAQFRNLSNTASQLMNTVDQIFEERVIKAKHPIYSAMGSFFVMLQQVTCLKSVVQAEEVYERMVQALEWIEQGINDVVGLCQEEIKETPPKPLKPQAPPTPLPSNTPRSQVPWFLVADVNPEEIVLSPEGAVKGGTLHGLVQRLTQHDQFDAKFNTTFLLTYRSFCTTEELFNELFQRYQLCPPDSLSSEETEVWNEKKLKLIRLRVFNVIKSWLETYFNEEEDRPILTTLSRFTDQVIVQSMKFGAEQLSKLIKKRLLAEDSGQLKKMKLNVRMENIPEPILPKSLKRIKLHELDPHELARQMTIMDFRLYNRIKPVECLDKNWGKPDVEEGVHIAANVKASIEHSNQVTAWVTDSILTKDETKRRASVIKFWISVADRCRALNNFNTCMAILSAFDNGSIGRLKRTWELIHGRSIQTLVSIRRLMGSNRNFSEYRDIIHRVNPPCIPFLGIYLQDLTFIEDGNSNFLKKSSHLISFAKRMKTASVIEDLQQYQSTHYMLTVVPDIQEFIKTHLQSSRDEEELYNLSLRLEPRERVEDTIRKRLKETGLE